MRPIIAALLLALTACSSAERIEEDLYELRSTRTQMLDGLYSDYGGSAAVEVSRQARTEGTEAIDQTVDRASREGVVIPESGADAARIILEAASGSIGQTDRDLFEGHCMTLGRGERPHTITDRSTEFFSQDAVRTECHEVYRLSQQIAALEAELVELQQGQ